jgi:hypothetical protein
MPNNISLTDAVMLTRNFRLNRELMVSSSFQNRNVLPTCESFPKEAIQKLLDQPGSQGIRVYLGMDGNLQIRLVMVAYDAENKDILPLSDNVVSGEIVEDGMRCPTQCPPPTVLNS